MRIIACIIITCGCATVGYMKSNEFLKRRELFYSLQLFCTSYTANLQYSKQPLEILISRARSRQAFDVCYAGYCSFSEEKHKKLSQYGVRLKNEDVQYIKDFFDGLGSQDSDGEREKTTFFASYFATRLEECKSDYDTKGRLCLKLGVAVGILLSILLV